jgi:FG-GAP repeat
MAPGWAIVETGDFNSDGKSDILWFNAGSGAVGAWLMNGATIKSPVGIGSLPSSWMIVNANAD